MTLSFSRDPFCCFVTGQDLITFWDCHRRPSSTSVGCRPPSSMTAPRRWCASTWANVDVPLHPEALAFAAHYGFSVVVAPARRPQFKGRVERQVAIVRDGVLRGRDFASAGEMDDAFAAWLPLRRAEVHRTHGEVISVRAERAGPPWGGYPNAPTSWSTATCARWARTAWSASRPASTRCRGGRCGAG